MGTEKRERQKANRQLKLEEIAKAQTKQQTKRRGLQIGMLAAAVVLLTAGFYFFGKSDDDGEAQSSTTVAAAAPTETVVPAVTQPAATDTTAAAGEPSETETPAPTVAGASVTGATECPNADGSSERTITFAEAPPMCIDVTKKYTAKVVTNVGEYTVELDAEQAPNTVNNFVTLAQYHYFDGITCHRAIPGFMVQCGDPTGTGSSGPGYEFDDELPEAGDYKIGSVVMANAGPNTNGSQFFVVTGDQGVALPPNYALFGQVTTGLETTLLTMDALGNDDPTSNGVPPLGLIQILSVEITEA